jgi:UDP-N-acetylmuramoyl-L-alanyl-D-glutamate--2,6-diaminopimelate ligase
MKLSDLLTDVPVRSVVGNAGVEITFVTNDSRLVRQGSLFIAVPGTQRDGGEFIPQALKRGAFAIVSQTEAKIDAQAYVIVEDARAAAALLAANFYGRPAEKLSLIGVTGTSGKTTTTRMIESILDAGSEPVGLIGTIEYRAGEERLNADRTTPDAIVLQEWFAKMVDAGVHHAVMEVSSHALALKRTHGVKFAAAVFTNLSREHFDFHRDFEDYFAAKKILFDQIDRSRKTAVVNVDDEYGRRLARELGEAVISFGREQTADIHPMSDFQVSVEGLRGRLVTPAGEVALQSALLGQPNLYNWMAAAGAAIAAGIPLDQIEAGMRNLQSVRGRFERVAADGGPTVIVDYAHKPDALEKLLHAVRDVAGGRRVVLLFGCGGDRDRGKRPEMGAIAGSLADFVVLTSDNPRGEDPETIIDEIQSGMRDVPSERYRRESDRRAAITQTIAEAGEDDVIVIAGKGHEVYQLVGDQILHLDDREEAEIALNKRIEKVST